MYVFKKKSRQRIMANNKKETASWSLTVLEQPKNSAAA